MKRVIITIFAGLLLTGSALGQEFDRPGNGMPSPEQRLERMIEHLELSDAQISQVDELVDSQREEMRTVSRALRSNRDALQALMRNEDYDPTVISTLAQEQGGLVAQQIELRAAMHAGLMSILTEEQKIQAQEMRGKNKARHGEHRTTGRPRNSES